jgi:hypothetical protein
MKKIFVFAGLLIGSAMLHSLMAQTQTDKETKQEPAKAQPPTEQAPPELVLKAPKPPTAKKPDEQHIHVPKAQVQTAKPVPPASNGDFGQPGQEPKKKD